MSRTLTATFGLIILGLSATSAWAQQHANFSAPEKPECIPGELLVKYKSGASSTAVTAAARQVGAEVVDSFDFIGVKLVKIPADRNPADTASALQASEAIEYAECNYRQFALVTPNDPMYPQQWGFPKINAPTAWSRITQAPNVIVAMIDTGISLTHPDLQANLWTNPAPTFGDVHGANFVPATPTGNPDDDNHHGTHTAGTVGAVTNNGTGVAGTTWRVQLMALKFLDANGSGSTANAIRAINYGIQHKADIMSNSWGGGGFSQALSDAINAANQAGILFVAAAGNAANNNDANAFYPCNYNLPNVICVAATDQNDNLASFSNFGAKTVHLGAPGVDILSTLPGASYGNLSGTSMATPHVAGAAALLKGAHPTWTAADLKQQILSTVDPLPSLQGKTTTGGRLDLGRALPPLTSCAPAPSEAAYEEVFFVANKQFSSNDNLLGVTFTLPQRMYATIVGNGSVQLAKAGGSSTFFTGLYSAPDPNVMFTGSLRRETITAQGNYLPVTTSFTQVLGPGTYTFYWKVWISGFTLQLDSANLTVHAVPCSMGGSILSVSEEEPLPQPSATTVTQQLQVK
ncbi:MAG: S8 family serine peptidase [Acetobacteraceae bacterium]|nr:S8 family serine peptidase [Acetobacteraceae bacterium]